MTQKNKKSIIKDTNYLLIQGFMVNQFHLKGNDLLIYAIIYGFSQTENQKFTGSLQYLADWTQSTKQGVIKSLKRLLERNLIEKEVCLKNKVKFCKYSLPVLNLVEQGIKQSLTGGIKQSLPNNKELYNKEDNKKKKSQKTKLLKDFSLEEKTISTLKAEGYSEEQINKTIISFKDYWIQGEGVGKQKKNWQSVFRNWIRKSKPWLKKNELDFEQQAKNERENQAIIDKLENQEGLENERE